AERGEGERKSVTGIALDRLFKQMERGGDLPCRQGHRISAQIEVISSEVAGRAMGRARRFSSLQCRLDDPGDTRSHLVLKLEYVFQRAVEAVGPEMHAACRVDQLRGNSNPASGFAHRAFEHIADAEFAPDLLHIDGLALVGEGAVAR